MSRQTNPLYCCCSQHCLACASLFSTMWSSSENMALIVGYTDNTANEAADSEAGGCRQAGGIEPLVSLLQGGQEKRAIKNASWALANLAKSNSDNKAAIREAKGIQVLWPVTSSLSCLCLACMRVARHSMCSLMSPAIHTGCEMIVDLFACDATCLLCVRRCAHTCCHDL